MGPSLNVSFGLSNSSNAVWSYGKSVMMFVLHMLFHLFFPCPMVVFISSFFFSAPVRAETVEVQEKKQIHCGFTSRGHILHKNITRPFILVLLSFLEFLFCVV